MTPQVAEELVFLEKPTGGQICDHLWVMETFSNTAQWHPQATTSAKFCFPPVFR